MLKMNDLEDFSLPASKSVKLCENISATLRETASKLLNLKHRYKSKYSSDLKEILGF
jgi:hypothetical protein